MRTPVIVGLGSLLLVGACASVLGCGGSSYSNRCRSSSDMPQGDMPCHEPGANSPQRDDEKQKHTPPGNPMPAR